MVPGVQGVFHRHVVHHHEASEGMFGINDEDVCHVENSTEVLHFQKRPALWQQYNGGCVECVSNDISPTRRVSAHAQTTFQLVRYTPSPS